MVSAAQQSGQCWEARQACPGHHARSCAMCGWSPAGRLAFWRGVGWMRAAESQGDLRGLMVAARKACSRWHGWAGPLLSEAAAYWLMLLVRSAMSRTTSTEVGIQSTTLACRQIEDELSLSHGAGCASSLCQACAPSNPWTYPVTLPFSAQDLHGDRDRRWYQAVKEARLMAYCRCWLAIHESLILSSAKDGTDKRRTLEADHAESWQTVHTCGARRITANFVWKDLGQSGEEL